MTQEELDSLYGIYRNDHYQTIRIRRVYSKEWELRVLVFNEATQQEEDYSREAFIKKHIRLSVPKVKPYLA